MIKNYLKIAFRNLQRHKGFSVINILGLAAGIACCIFILLYIQFELSYDTFHKDAHQIFRVALTIDSKNGSRTTIGNSPLLANALKDIFPQVEFAGRTIGWPLGNVKYGEKIFKEERVRWADQHIIDIFSIPFIHGNPKTALERPFTAVMVESLSRKYYGNTNPVGTVIRVDTSDFEITGVIPDPPANTHFKYNMFLSLKSIQNDPHFQKWEPGMTPAVTYLKLAKDVDAEAFEKQIRDLPHRFIGEELERRSQKNTYFLQAVPGIHLYSNWGEMEAGGNVTYLTIFSLVAFFILLIACMNFMNLATARSAQRAREIGMRKVVGAQRSQLVWQFLGESLLMTFLAFILAIILVIVLNPLFNELAEIKFSLAMLWQPSTIFILIGLMLFIGLIAGSYPAFLLSAFRPIQVLQRRLSLGNRGTGIRKILVIFQFVISVTLIIVTITLFRQINYMKNKPLGFNSEQKLVIEFPRHVIKKDVAEAVKNDFEMYPSIRGATFSSSVPGRWLYYWRLWPNGEETENAQLVHCFQVDFDFFSEYDIEMVYGQQFQKELSSNSGYIFNQAAVKAFGWESPQQAIGKNLCDNNDPVIGVFKDFHYQGLQRTIGPMGIFLMSGDFRYLSLKVDVKNLAKTISFIKSKFKEWAPDYPLQYFFLDEEFEQNYRSEERLVKIFRTFTILGIFIACLGLFGLASFIAEQRTKEIGIRKTLGASVASLILLLSREFTKWVMLANLIAWPFAYFAIRRWLQNFAYRIDISLIIFVLAAAIAMAIALLTVSYQAIHAAQANPVDALKYE